MRCQIDPERAAYAAGRRLGLPWLVVPGLLAAAAAGALEQPEPPAPGRGVYLIFPGDRLAISVAGRPDLSCEVNVPREGKVMLPGAGVVRAGGRGIEELSAEIARLLDARERLLDARVLVSVVSYGVRRAFVYGAVAQARAVELPTEAEMTVTQAIASCGGFTGDGDRERVRITRRKADGEPPHVMSVDTGKVADGVAPELDPVLEPGDTVFVPRREPVYVLGEVRQQGALQVPFEYPLTVSKAVAMSGGFTPYARHSRVSITRRSAGGVQKFAIDAGEILARGELGKDMELEPGDMVYVPERVF